MTEEAKKLTPWEKYKAAHPEKPARPWDLLNKELRLDEKIAEERFAICLECPELIPVTHQCRRCGCFMKQKTKLANASCPLDPPKWTKVELTTK
jgi:hypothetical protein